MTAGDQQSRRTRRPDNERFPSREPCGSNEEDFREEAPRKFFRLKKGGAVRLRAGYIVDCHDVVKDDDGNVTEILCTYDPETKSGSDNSGRKVKGTIHWVSAEHAVEVQVRNYDRLFTVENPDATDEGGSFLDHLNPDSLATDQPPMSNRRLPKPKCTTASNSNGLATTSSIRQHPGELVFNRIVPLRDSWGKMEAKGKTG